MKETCEKGVNPRGGTGDYLGNLTKCFRAGVHQPSWKNRTGSLDISVYPGLKKDVTKFLHTARKMARLSFMGDSNFRLGDTQIQMLNVAMETYLPQLTSASYASNPMIVRSLVRIPQRKPGVIGILPRRVGKSTMFGKFSGDITRAYPKEAHQIFAMKIDQAAIIVNIATNLSRDANNELPKECIATKVSFRVNHQSGGSFIEANTARDVRVFLLQNT